MTKLNKSADPNCGDKFGFNFAVFFQDNLLLASAIECRGKNIDSREGKKMY